MDAPNSQSSVASTCSIGGLEGIAELLRCYICMEGLKDTALCPHCCKLVCFNCVTRWISETRADCPHCRESLTVRELVKMPIFDDFVKKVEDLRSKQEDMSSPSKEVQLCPTHSHPLSVYCDTCQVAICYECALFSGQHKEHTFQPLEKLNKKHKRALEAELHRLKNHMRDILSFVLQVEKRVEVIKVNKSKSKKEIREAVEKMCQQVDSKAKEKLTKLAECRHYLHSQAFKVMKVAHDMERKIASDSYRSLVNEEGELKKELRESLDKLYTLPLKPEVLSASYQLPNELVPPYTGGVFEIHPFKELQRRGEEIYSDYLLVDGLKWRLKVYLNGHHEDIGRYLAVFMELSEGYKGTTSYEYCIEMLYNCSDKYPQRNYSRAYVSDFADGECWGYKKYYQLSKLAADGFLKDDTLRLRFSVRHVTYHDKWNDLSECLRRVSEERNFLKDRVKEYQEQLTTLKTENKKLVSSGESPPSSTCTSCTHTHTHPIAVRPRSSPAHSRAEPRAEPKPSRRISPRSSRQHSTFSHHSQQSHSHSNSHESPRNVRYSMSASQQALNSPHHGSPKRSTYSKQQLSEDPSSRHFLRRRSHDATLNPHKVIDHRRRSAEPLVNLDPEAEGENHPPMLRGRPYYSQRDRVMFDESNSDHGGSQSLATEDMLYAPEDIGSNASTLTGGPFKVQDLSQAEFNEEDHSELHTEPPALIVESETGYLSQPSSPPKSRVGKSLTDIHALSSNPLSHSQQFLSQSIAEFPGHYPSPWDGASFYPPHEARWFHDGRFRRPVAKPTMSASQGQIHRMRSDPHLNFEPASAKSSALKKVAEEEEGQRRSRGQQLKVKGHHQLPKKHLHATRVPETTAKAESAKPNASGDSRDDKLKTGGLSGGGKSNSTSSLNLSQIL